MRTLRPVLLAAALAVGGCSSVGLGGGAPSLTAANNAPPTEKPPQNEFYALLDSEAGAAAFAAQQQAVQAPSGGVAVPWQAGGITGTVTPGPIHTVNQRVCRDVVLVSLRDKERVRGRSTLCRNRAGDWEPLDAL